MGKTTPLFGAHEAAGAKIVDFSGWDMPLHYGSQLEEHHQVRRDAGMFDVSHMQILDLTGAGAQAFLLRLLANDVSKLCTPGKALYSCMLREDGGVIDDVIVYGFAPDDFRMVVNAGTADKDLAWIRAQAGRLGANVSIESRRTLAMIAVQGPEARTRTWAALPGSGALSQTLRPFEAVRWPDSPWGELMIARTGYTGEDGFELMFSARHARAIWQALREAGVTPAGLGARDTLRLEAGMNLYGQDMDEWVTPLESGLGWTVAFTPERAFIGREALEGDLPRRKLVGLLLEEPGVLRAHMPVFTHIGAGETTSGGFSPTLKRSIALARVPTEIELGEQVEVDVRGKPLKARVVRPPFVRNGRAALEGL